MNGESFVTNACDVCPQWGVRRTQLKKIWLISGRKRQNVVVDPTTDVRSTALLDSSGEI